MVVDCGINVIPGKINNKPIQLPFFCSNLAKVNYAVMQYLVNKKSTFQHFMTGPEWNSEFCFPRISVFPKIMLLETLGFEGNKIHYSTRDKSLTDL